MQSSLCLRSSFRVRWSLPSSSPHRLPSASDPHPERDGDDGAQAGGGGHPVAPQPAGRRLPRSALHSRGALQAASGDPRRLRAALPGVRRGRRTGRRLGRQGTPGYIADLHTRHSSERLLLTVFMETLFFGKIQIFFIGNFF